MHPDAVQDILNNSRYEGMISTISGVTDFVDQGFTIVITFVAFFIISVAVLRNVLAGAYCAYPKFWDDVQAAHEANASKTLANAVEDIKGAYQKATIGTVKQFILGLLPNIKVMTEFMDDSKDAKSYFIKAIPQMIAAVIIGVFIYNGYYRDFTSIIADAGSDLLERTVLSVDPMGVFDTIMNTAGKPVFSTDASLDEYGKTRNKLANAIYSAIIGKFSDIRDANAKANLAQQIDSCVEAIMPADNEGAKAWLGNPDRWKVQINVDVVKEGGTVGLWQNLEEGSLDAGTLDIVQYGCTIGIGRSGDDYMLTSGQGAGGMGGLQISFDTQNPDAKEEWYLRVKVLGQRNTNQKGATGFEGTISLGLSPITITIPSGATCSLSISTDKGSFTSSSKGSGADKEKVVTLTPPSGASKITSVSGRISAKCESGDYKGKTFTVNISKFTDGGNGSITVEAEDKNITCSLNPVSITVEDKK